VFREDFFKNYNLFSSNGEVYECGFSGVEEPLKKNRDSVPYFGYIFYYL